MGDLFGWLLLLLSFPLVLVSERIRRDNQLTLVCWFTVAAHHAAALTNCFIIALPSQSWDSKRFQEAATNWETPNLLHKEAYVKFLGTVYEFFGESLFLGHEVSVMAFTISLLALVDLVCLLGHDRHVIAVVLVFGLLPGALAHRAVILREGFQSLFLVFLIHQLVRLRLQRSPVADAAGALLSMLALTMMHSTLGAFAALVGGPAFVWAMHARREVGILVAVAMLAAAPLVVPTIIEHTVQGNAEVFVDKGFTAIANYRETVDSRANYNLNVDFSSFGGILTGIPLILFAYFFMPLPWQVSSPLDLYGMLECVMRAGLLYGAYKDWRTRHPMRGLRLFVLVGALAIETYWALGTFNWGQALRHHVVSVGLLLAVGLPPLLEATGSTHTNEALARRRARRNVGEDVVG